MGIIKAALRSFCVTFSVLFAILLAFFLFALLVATSEETSDGISKQSNDYTPYRIANAKNDRHSKNKKAPVILQLDLRGIVGIDEMTPEAVRRKLLESQEGDLAGGLVKAVLVIINSPGGSVDASEGIYRAIKDYKAQYNVPVYCFVEGMALSGGYYIACSCDKIYSDKTSLLGSIGVVSAPFFNLTKLINALGVQSLTLTAGKDKDLMNPFREWHPEEPKEIQNVIDAFYNHFVNLVVEARPEVTREWLIKDFGAGILPAGEASDARLTDGAGMSRSAVIKELIAAAGLSEDNYQVIELQSTNWLKRLFSNRNSLFSSGSVRHTIDLGDGIPKELRGKLLFLHQGF